MAVWNETTPDDATYLANVIHTQIQADKAMIGERFEADDGTITGHKDKDSEDSGIHEASVVGWVKVHADVAARDAFTPVLEGTLHFVTATSALFVADEALDFVQIFPVDHLLLADKDTGDDHAYQDVDFSKAFTADLKVAALVVNDATGAGDTDPLDEATHGALDWEAAHGAASLHGVHMDSNSLNGDDMCNTPASASEAAIAHAANTYGFPWHLGNGSSGLFHNFRSYDVGFGFERASWADGTTKCGKFKA